MRGRYVAKHSTRAGVRRRPTVALIAVVAMLGGFVTAVAAAATPVYEIRGDWAAGTPTSTSNGRLVTAEWRVNVNDDQKAPANDNVPNVNFSVTATHGKFASIPTPCKTAGVTPKSAITNSGATLVCNLGTQREGTAYLVQAPMVVNGLTGQKISAVGTIDGQTDDVPPIPISNTFGEDILWGTPSNQRAYTLAGRGTDVAFGLEWTLRTAPGSDPGPNTVSYNLTITNTTNRSLTVGAPYIRRAPCTAYDYANPADGHPWSGRRSTNQTAPFVTTCTFTHVSGTTYRLTLSGIDYSKTLLPTRDSAGTPLTQVTGTWQPVASGTIWLTLHNEQENTSVNLRSNTPTYRSPSGKTYRDLDTNSTNTNSTNKFLPLPGNWSASWTRSYTHSGGTDWDNTYKVPVLTKVQARSGDVYGRTPGIPNTAVVGDCVVLDYKYVSYVSSVVQKWQPTVGTLSPISGARLQYYTGAGGGANAQRLNPNSSSYNPNAFTCDGSAGWTNTKPAAGAIKAVRAYWRRGATAGYNSQLLVVEQVRSNVRVGQDVWMWGSTLQGWRSNHWIDPRRDTNNPGPNTLVPRSRYNYTTGARDVLHVIGPTPTISKSASPTVINPGQVVTYTLRYQMLGGPGLKFNNVRIVDTLPAGMTYVAGSANPATPAPTVSGRTLTWVLNGVPSNTLRTITFRATAGAITPGQALTNNVAMTYGTQVARSSAQVTGSTSGYTTLLKTADQLYIPNPNLGGTGTGTWTVTLRSFDPLPQTFTDVIDILPYEGDGRGTSFHGSYTLNQVTPPAGSTVYYTTADPTTLTDDPADPSNGGAGTITGNTVGWSTTYNANATAIRVIGPTLNPGATRAFKVSITNTGADPGDTYVNRAQGRAGHTALVMRTSAKLIMSPVYSYTIKKYVQDSAGEWHDANGIADAPTFKVGDTVHYRITVTNTGSETLTNLKVSDDKYGADGAFTIASLDSLKSVSHEYSEKIGPNVTSPFINNACATPDGATDVSCSGTTCTGDSCTECTATSTGGDDGLEAQCDPAIIQVFNYDVTKSADPASGTAVSPGQKVTYTIKVNNTGDTPAPALVTDPLNGVLDDATYNKDAKADLGAVEYKNGILGWSGTVPVGESATITFSVTVKSAAALTAGTGDANLHNCVENADPAKACTDNPVGWYIYDKVSDPVSKTPVGVGSTVKYTVTIQQQGAAAIPGASVDDDMTDVLDDATYNNDVQASSGTATVTAPHLTWTGDLAVGQKVTITYTVKVTGDGDKHLDNPVTTDDRRGSCNKPVGCEPEHPIVDYMYQKVSDPASGANVHAGDVIHYTLTVTPLTPGGVHGAKVVDDMSKVLDDATYNDDAEASGGEVSYSKPNLTWTGDLPATGAVTITYTVTVTGQGDRKLGNTLSSSDVRSACNDPVGCATEQAMVGAAEAGPSGTANTGNMTALQLVLASMLLGAGGLLTLLGLRRRRQVD